MLPINPFEVHWHCPICQTENIDLYDQTAEPMCGNCDHQPGWQNILTPAEQRKLNKIMSQTTIIPKGKAAKAAKKAEYRTTLFAYVRRFTGLGGSSGIVRLAIREWGNAKVNGAVTNDDRYPVKPGDQVTVLTDDDVWKTYTVTADQIEKTW